MELAEFFEYIYGESKGYAYVALKNPKTNSFVQHFFRWPEEVDRLVDQVKKSSHTHEVYYAPALFAKASGQKIDVSGSQVVWVEFDGKVPSTSQLHGVPKPSLRIRSSDDSHEHWYWRIDGSIDRGEIDRINRALTYALGADVSGWDASQILRPPGTTNHKRQLPVSLISVTDVVLPVGQFSVLPEPPPIQEIPLPESIPDVQSVIAKYAFKESLWKLFQGGVQEGRRSEGLMALGHGLAEMALSAPEMLSVLVNADARWGKFANRSDQLLRLNEIIVRAKVKHPDLEVEAKLVSYGFLSLLEHEVELEWVWENFLEKQGYLLLTGPPGVGKTLFSLGFSIAASLGKSFLGNPMVVPRKIGFLSLEMPLAPLKLFVSKLAEHLTIEEKNLLQENLQLVPLGEPLYLTQTQPQLQITEFIGDNQLDGIVIDSMMSATEKSVTDEEVAKKLMDWNDRIRTRLGIFTCFVHHHRKDQAGNRKPNHLSDVYGNVVITARSTTTFCLWKDEGAEQIDLIPLKVRLTETPKPMKLTRNPDLSYTLDSANGLTVVSKPTEESPVLGSIYTPGT